MISVQIFDIAAASGTGYTPSVPFMIIDENASVIDMRKLNVGAGGELQKDFVLRGGIADPTEDDPTKVTSEVEGIVNSVETGLPLSNVEVVNLRTGEIVQTSRSGSYKIAALPGDQLEFRLGDSKETVSIGSSKNILVALDTSRFR